MSYSVIEYGAKLGCEERENGCKVQSAEWGAECRVACKVRHKPDFTKKES